jgi:hypothetical protein
MKIGEILVRKKLVSSQQLDSLLVVQNFVAQPLGELLVNEGLVTREQVQNALDEQYWRKKGFWVID